MSTTSLNLESILQTHLQLCQEVLVVISQENSLLKLSPTSLDDQYLQEKGRLLDKVNHSVKNLKAINADHSVSASDGYLQKMIDKAQNILMKIFLLDRENERLLLQSSFRKPQLHKAIPSANRIRDIYKS